MCEMVHFTSEKLVSSWYTYAIKIHIKYLLPQVWNKTVAYLPTYQSKKKKKKKKWDIEPKPCAYRYITKNQKNQQIWVSELLGLREGFFIAKYYLSQ